MEENRIKKAAFNHKNGYNCAQAVACAYSKAVGIDEETLLNLTSGFGIGMGNMEGSCGAVSAAVMIAGLKAKQAGLSKKDARILCSKISNQFIKKNHAIVCKQLKGIETGTVLRDCHSCVTDAAEMLEETLNEIDLKTAE